MKVKEYDEGLNQLVAYKCLNNIKLLLPKTDSKQVNFICDINVKFGESEDKGNKLKQIVNQEKQAINKIVALMYYQKNFTVFPETTSQLQEIAGVVFDICVKKGYQRCGLNLLKCVASGVIELESIPYPQKVNFLHDGVLEILESYGERQILCPEQEFTQRVKKVMEEANAGIYGIEFKKKELLNAYNNAQIGSKRVPYPIKSVEGEGEN